MGVVTCQERVFERRGRTKGRLAVQGGCGQSDVTVDHDATSYLAQGACCGASFSQPYRQALESSSEDHGIPPRNKGMGLTFVRGSGLHLTTYSDADYADKSNDRHSVSGTVITLGGAAVSWASSTQRCVTLSTAEAEYVTLGEGVKEALFTGAELSALCVRVITGNQGAIALAWRLFCSARNKHIDVRFHFVRGLLRATKIHIQFVASEEQHADILTKSLSATPVKTHRKFC